MPKIERGIGSNAFNTLITQIFYLVLTFITGIIIARSVGPWGKGIYSLVALTATLGAIFTGIGLPTANACFAGKKQDKMPSLVLNSIFALIIPVIVLTVVFLAMRFRIEPSKLKFVGFAFILTPCVLLITLFNEIIHGLNKIPEFNLIKILPALITVIFVGILLFTKNLNLINILFCWALGNIGAMLVAIFMVFHHNRGVKYSLDFALFKESLGFGSQVWLMQIIGQLNLRFDLFLIAYFLTAREVGYYSVATTVAGFLFFIPGSIAIASLPRFTRTDLKSAAQIACRGTRTTLFFNLFLLLALLGIGKFIIPFFYGTKFAPAISPLLILVPGFYFFGIAHITTAYFNGALGKPFINAILAGLSLVIDITLNFILIPKMGISGAALACTLSYVISITVAMFIFTRLSGASIMDFLFLKKSDLRKIWSLFQL